MEDADAQVLMRKGKRGCASFIQAQCNHFSDAPQLNLLLDTLLNPLKPIDDYDNIEWIKWLVAGGKTPAEFATTVRRYDTATTCGLVWTANFVAYRCRTCGISPCMSLCSDCFQRGDHDGHDFNMFRSQAGGACDCGDSSVMKESGFCERHRPKPHVKKKIPPRELLCVAELIMPRVYLRLIQHLRQHSDLSGDDVLGPVATADSLVALLHEYSSWGAAMRHVMTSAICNPQIYSELTEVPEDDEPSERVIFMKQTDQLYKKALKNLPGPEPPEEYQDYPALSDKIYHRTFLEEFVFWTAKYEFPQKIVCWLLNMLPDPKYKEELTRAFVLHYGRISKMLNKTGDSDMLSNRVVHVSVQLFSNEELAFKMVDTMHLLQVMAVSLRDMAVQVLTPCMLHHTEKNVHMVVDCSHHTMKDHCYWPIVSDMNNVLSHKNIALRFMQDETLLKMWFSFLAMFQGMNVNVRELGNHVEFEPTTYYAAFSGELEASACAMWALALHLKDGETLAHTRRLLDHCFAAVRTWFDAVGFTDPDNMDPYQLTFHIPLHRNIAAFTCQALKYQGAAMSDIIPDPRFMRLLMMHPLRVQVGFYEILAGMWVRNGLQIKGQAMTYLQCHFGNSMVDADIYLLQLCATQVKPSTFLMTVIEKFHVLECLSVSPNSRYTFLEPDQEVFMIEACLTFLASLMSIRTYIGDSDAEVFSLEVLSILCMGDKTHSQLLELIPEKCGSPQTKDIDAVLSEVADYRAPNFEASGTLQQGMYVPKADVWEKLYDPIYVLLRAVHRRDFQSSMDRFTEYVHQSNRYRGKTLWPPFRPPSPVHPSHTDPRVVLTSSTFIAFCFVVLEKFVTNSNTVSEQAISLCIYLLNIAVSFFSCRQPSGQELMISGDNENEEFTDMKFNEWFSTDYLPDNLCKVVDKITLQEVTAVSFQSSDGGEMYEESSDADMDVSEITSEVADQSAGSSAHAHLLALEGQSSSLVPSGTSIPTSCSSSSISRRAILAGNELIPLSNTAGLALVRSSGQHGDVYRPVGSVPALPAGNEVVLSEGMSPDGLFSSRQALPPSGAASRSEATSSVPNAICGSSQQEKVDIGESVISLLLKIHSRLSGGNDSYIPPSERPQASEETDRESFIGDGPFFIGKLLDKIWHLDERCRTSISEARRNLWPRTQEMIDQEMREKEAKEKEERKRKAKERQQKLMAEFASKQKSFIDKYKAMETEPTSEETSAGDAESVMVQRREEYDCVICNQTSPSTYERPMCLVILIQSTSTAGHRRCAVTEPGEQAQTTWALPLKDEDREALKKSTTLAAEMERRIDRLKQNFDEESWLLSVNNGWEGGIYVQTCGHHLHMDCHKSYVQSLRTLQRHQTTSADKGEYSCPLCRQQSNAALPLAPELGDVMTLVASQAVAPSVLAKMIHSFLIDDPPVPVTGTQLNDAIGKVMDDITHATYVRYRPASTSPSNFSLFINSVARQALEVEIVMRGDSITGPPVSKFQAMMVPKHRKSCFVPLVHVLAMQMKILRSQQHNSMWSQVTGVPAEVRSTTLLPAPENQVPLLLRDPVALLFQLVLVLPLHMDRAYLSCMISVFYNLTFFQCLAQVVLKMPRSKCDLIKRTDRDPEETYTLLNSLKIIMENLEPIMLSSDETSEPCSISIAEILYDIELEVQRMCLPYLRIVSLLVHHFYGEQLPQGSSRNETEECVLLLRYLGLVNQSGPILTSPGEVLMEVDMPAGPSTSEEGVSPSAASVNSLQRTKASIVKASSYESMKFSSEPVFFVTAEALKWVCELPDSVKTVGSWLSEFNIFARQSQAVARSLVLSYRPWNPPKLLDLPHSYDPLFQYYHKKACSQCNSVPKEPTVCLVCGTVVCLRDNCCKQQNLFEAVKHSIDCGAGTAVYLAINSSTIVVVRGKRACLWGSVYLDVFGEEDRELKRGKPLYLSKERYEILEQQWLSHRFDHTSKKWIMHRDNL